MFYSRASEALILFIRLLLTGSVAFETYPSKTAAEGIIKKCGIIKRLWLNFLAKKRYIVKGTEFPVLKPGVCTINCTGDVTRIEVIPRWCCL